MGYKMISSRELHDEVQGDDVAVRVCITREAAQVAADCMDGFIDGQGEGFSELGGALLVAHDHAQHTRAPAYVLIRID